MAKSSTVKWLAGDHYECNSHFSYVILTKLGLVLYIEIANSISEVDMSEAFQKLGNFQEVFDSAQGQETYR